MVSCEPNSISAGVEERLTLFSHIHRIVFDTTFLEEKLVHRKRLVAAVRFLDSCSKGLVMQ